MSSTKGLGTIDSLRQLLIGGMQTKEIEQHYVIPGWLDRNAVVLDLGGNVGRFSRAIREHFDCKVVVVEPEANNFDAIPVDDRTLKCCAAVAGRCGTILLEVSASDCTAHVARLNVAGTAASRKGQRVELIDFSTLIERVQLSRIDYMKVDIEGCEWDLFDAMSDHQLVAIPQIAVEFHDFVPEFDGRARTWGIYSRLRGLGFRCIEDPRFGSYNVLFAQPRARGAGRSHALRLRLLDSLLGAKWKLSKFWRLLCR